MVALCIYCREHYLQYLIEYSHGTRTLLIHFTDTEARGSEELSSLPEVSREIRDRTRILTEILLQDLVAFGLLGFFIPLAFTPGEAKHAEAGACAESSSMGGISK